MGLSQQIFGKEADFVQSDMQFAKQAAAAFWAMEEQIDDGSEDGLDKSLALELHTEFFQDFREHKNYKSLPTNQVSQMIQLDYSQQMFQLR